jgi:hypothetical protein
MVAQRAAVALRVRTASTIRRWRRRRHPPRSALLERLDGLDVDRPAAPVGLVGARDDSSNRCRNCCVVRVRDRLILSNTPMVIPVPTRKRLSRERRQAAVAKPAAILAVRGIGYR